MHVLHQFDYVYCLQVREGLFDKFQNGEVDLLICTDIASRGLDTIRVRYYVKPI